MPSLHIRNVTVDEAASIVDRCGLTATYPSVYVADRIAVSLKPGTRGVGVAAQDLETFRDALIACFGHRAGFQLMVGLRIYDGAGSLFRAERDRDQPARRGPRDRTRARRRHVRR